MRAHMKFHTYIDTHTHAHAHLHIQTHTHTHTCIHTHACTYTHVCTYTHACTHTHTRAHTQELGKGGPIIDDFQAEGQARMFDLIKRTAVKEEKPLSGVWASFGKPYICLGKYALVLAGLGVPMQNAEEWCDRCCRFFVG